MTVLSLFCHTICWVVMGHNDICQLPAKSTVQVLVGVPISVTSRDPGPQNWRHFEDPKTPLLWFKPHHWVPSSFPHMEVSKYRGLKYPPNHENLFIGFFSIIFTIHFRGFPPIFENTHMRTIPPKSLFIFFRLSWITSSSWTLETVWL